MFSRRNHWTRRSLITGGIAAAAVAAAAVATAAPAFASATPVTYDTNAPSGQVWGTMYIDPKTGRRAAANAPGALNVWTFRNRPVYTFAGYRGYGDHKPSEINANGWGEGNAGHNGFMAIIYRDISDSRDGIIGRGAER